MAALTSGAASEAVRKRTWGSTVPRISRMLSSTGTARLIEPLRLPFSSLPLKSAWLILMRPFSRTPFMVISENLRAVIPTSGCTSSKPASAALSLARPEREIISPPCDAIEIIPLRLPVTLLPAASETAFRSSRRIPKNSMFPLMAVFFPPSEGVNFPFTVPPSPSASIL